MRVRNFELRLLGGALAACWIVSGGLILLTYRPGGPFDLIVGLLSLGPIAIAAAGVVWPPVSRSDRAFSAITWLGIIGLLCLVPTTVGIFNQLTALGSQTLLPSIESAYPWLVALLATSLFAGLGVARRVRGGNAMRRERLIAGVLVAVVATGLSGAAFGAVAVANDIALRDRAITSSRFGPTGGAGQPVPCDMALATGPTARVHERLDAVVDLRPIGSVEVTGLRVGRDFRWLAYVATSRELGEYGSARTGGQAWTRSPALGWQSVAPGAVDAGTLDAQAVAVALTLDFRTTAEDRGVEVLEGARARRCRVAVDGATFELAFPQVGWLVGSADLHRWRGQLDYWVFLDGEIGQIAGSLNGEAADVAPDALQGTVEVLLTATERGRSFVIYPPTR